MSQRMQRLADQIQREIAVLIRNLKDPRLGMVTVSAVKVSKDMGYADVYVTVLGKELDVDYQPSLAVLNNAANFLRAALGKSLQIRMIPRLRFHYDQVVVNGNRMAELIHQALSEDQKNHQTDAAVSSSSDNQKAADN